MESSRESEVSLTPEAIQSEAKKLPIDLKLQDELIFGVVTPMDKNEKINYPLIPQMAQYCKDNNIKSIYIAGYYGGGPQIPLDERKCLVKAWEEQCNRYGFDLIVEVGALPAVDTLEMARYCSTLNVSAITAYAEIVYQATKVSEELEDLQRICDASGNKLPLMYHDLLVSDQDVTPDAIFLGAKDGCVSCFVGLLTSINVFLDCKAAVNSIDGYQFFGYGIDNIAASLKVGMNGSLTINLFPDLGFKIKDAVHKCNLDEAADIQQDLNRKTYAMTNLDGGTVDPSSRTYVERLKEGYLLLNDIDPGFRYPAQRPNSTDINKMRSNLQNLGVSLPYYKKKN